MNIVRVLVGRKRFGKGTCEGKIAILSLFSYKRTDETDLWCISTKPCSWFKLKWNHFTKENYNRPKCTLSNWSWKLLINSNLFVPSVLFFSGDSNSFVMGHIFEGKFDGSFFAFGESFYLEPAERYFHFKTSFHSIIFPASSVHFKSSGIQRKMARFKDLQPVVAQVLTFL